MDLCLLTLYATHSPRWWQGTSVKDVWLSWWALATLIKARNPPLLICWEIWLARNKLIFWNIISIWHTISAHILAIYHLILYDDVIPSTRTTIPEDINGDYPWAYFDGSAQDGGCGGGADILYLYYTHFKNIHMGLGMGTNNYAKLITLRHLLQFSLQKHCRNIQIFGDSKIVIYLINKNSSCHSYTLRHIVEEAHTLIALFDLFVSPHIYRDRNQISD